jgi:hypothetical protein
LALLLIAHVTTGKFLDNDPSDTVWYARLKFGKACDTECYMELIRVTNFPNPENLPCRKSGCTERGAALVDFIVVAMNGSHKIWEVSGQYCSPCLEQLLTENERPRRVEDLRTLRQP